jgi:hypothetical protein
MKHDNKAEDASSGSSRSPRSSGPHQDAQVPGFTRTTVKAPGRKADLFVLINHGFVRMVANLFAEIGMPNAMRCLAIINKRKASKMRMSRDDREALSELASLFSLIRKWEPKVIERSKRGKPGTPTDKKRLKATRRRYKTLELRTKELYEAPEFARRFRDFPVGMIDTLASEAAYASAIMPVPSTKKHQPLQQGSRPDAKKYVKKAVDAATPLESNYHGFAMKLELLHNEMDEASASGPKLT